MNMDPVPCSGSNIYEIYASVVNTNNIKSNSITLLKNLLSMIAVAYNNITHLHNGEGLEHLVQVHY